MRFVTVEVGGHVRAGVVDDDGVHLLPPATSILGLVERGLATALQVGARAVSEPAVPLDLVRLLPPLSPPTVRDFVAFEEHVEGVVQSVAGGAGVVAEWYDAPTFYFTNPFVLVGTGDDVAVPPGSQLLDFELEVAVVVGGVGGSTYASLTPEVSQAHLFG